MRMIINKALLYAAFAIVIAFTAVNVVRAATGYVDPTYKWAWGTNIGWINFSPTHGGVTVYDDHLEGYAWAENIGWIRLGTYAGGGAHTYANDAADTYGVNNDGAGNLSGYAWGTNIGWVNFNPTHGGVTVDPTTGAFDGYAWAENVGWISFSGDTYQVAANNTLKILADGVVAENQVVTAGAVLYGDIQQISIHFSKNVSNPAGSSGEDDVTNPANYLLFQRGEDEVFDTVSCDAVPGVDDRDVEIAVGPVYYANGGSNGPYVATLTLNKGRKLPKGEYRLMVCGSTSIVDLNGVALAGDGVTSGTDWETTFTVSETAVLPETGFPQGVVAELGAQPLDKLYAETNLTLEIPALNISTAIEGVPLTEDGWDVSWLGSHVGYLDGSAFPTWEGNTVITGHVWDADNQPGIFSDLKSLRYGDQIYIQAWGQTYVYEVRENTLLNQSSLDKVMQPEEIDWLTLLTCENYNPASEMYQYRRMVRAVLVEVW
ncbi:sortase [bacterium]|nr:sortase [bacterium]